jgi:hypothetical protein
MEVVEGGAKYLRSQPQDFFGTSINYWNIFVCICIIFFLEIIEVSLSAHCCSQYNTSSFYIVTFLKQSGSLDTGPIKVRSSRYTKLLPFAKDIKRGRLVYNWMRYTKIVFETDYLGDPFAGWGQIFSPVRFFFWCMCGGITTSKKTFAKRLLHSYRHFTMCISANISHHVQLFLRRRWFRNTQMCIMWSPSVHTQYFYRWK